MPLRDWILAALLATAGVLFTVGAGLEWGSGVGLMVGAVLMVVWSWLTVTDDGTPDEPDLVEVEE